MKAMKSHEQENERDKKNHRSFVGNVLRDKQDNDRT